MAISPNRDLELLHPAMRPLVVAMLSHPTIKHYEVQLFEGYRSPARQLQLFNQTPRVTKAGPWRSLHQYGLAADLVPKPRGKWSWDVDMVIIAEIQKAAHECGLRTPIDWDPLHCEHPSGERIMDWLF